MLTHQNTHKYYLTSRPTSPLLSLLPGRVSGACVGVIVENHCRNLAVATFWRAAPR